MRRISIFLSAACALVLSVAQTSAQSAPAAVGHGSFPVKIDKTLDSSKLKANDTVEVETSGSFKLADGTLVPKGSKIVGHVVEAQARSKGDTGSQLNLVFDKLNIQGGKQLTVKGVVQAVYPPAEEPQGPNMATAGTSQGGSVGGGGTTPGGFSPGGIGITNSKNGSNMDASSPTSMTMDMKATGVQGMGGDLSLEDGVLRSKGKNVKLSGGVRLIVRADILG